MDIGIQNLTTKPAEISSIESASENTTISIAINYKIECGLSICVFNLTSAFSRFELERRNGVSINILTFSVLMATI